MNLVKRFSTPFERNDPVITDVGVDHAYQVGHHLVAYKLQLEHQLNDGLPFEEVVIESSPYLRTMMTCAMVCKAFKEPVFRLNYEFGEFLEPSMRLKEDPIPNLTVK